MEGDGYRAGDREREIELDIERVRQIELDIQIDRESWREIYLEIYRVRWRYIGKDRCINIKIEIQLQRVRDKLVDRYMYIVVQIRRFIQIYV